MQLWIADRISLWGDEFDTMAPAFRPWRGGKDFWWQIGQYNANPPGDNFVLRQYHLSGVLPWLRELSPELFWRLPYISLFLATLLVAAWGTWRWTKSAFLSFLVVVFFLNDLGFLEYGCNVRFYIWLAFFMTALLYSFIGVMEKPSLPRFAGLCGLSALALCFHLMLASVAYYILACTLVWVAVEAARLKSSGSPWRRGLRMITVLLAGAVPFTLYKVEMKHWVFIPPPNFKVSPMTQLLRPGTGDGLIRLVNENIAPLPIFNGNGLCGLLALLGFASLWLLLKRRYFHAAVGVLLFSLLGGTPITLFIKSAERSYELTGRHFIYQGPVVAVSVLFLMQFLIRAFKDRLVAVRRIITPIVLVAMVLVSAKLTWATFDTLSRFASDRRAHTPGRVNYMFPQWRQFYRSLPEPRTLVIVGSQPDQYHWASDTGGYRAGQMRFYTLEFEPLFYSVKGTFNAREESDPGLAAEIERNPDRYDFLVLDDSAVLRKLLPKLPWKRWRCKEYRNVPPTGEQELNFCRT